MCLALTSSVERSLGRDILASRSMTRRVDQLLRRVLLSSFVGWLILFRAWLSQLALGLNRRSEQIVLAAQHRVRALGQSRSVGRYYLPDQLQASVPSLSGKGSPTMTVRLDRRRSADRSLNLGYMRTFTATVQQVTHRLQGLALNRSRGRSRRLGLPPVSVVPLSRPVCRIQLQDCQRRAAQSSRYGFRITRSCLPPENHSEDGTLAILDQGGERLVLDLVGK